MDARLLDAGETHHHVQRSGPTCTTVAPSPPPRAVSLSVTTSAVPKQGELMQASQMCADIDIVKFTIAVRSDQITTACVSTLSCSNKPPHRRRRGPRVQVGATVGITNNGSHPLGLGTDNGTHSHRGIYVAAPQRHPPCAHSTRGTAQGRTALQVQVQVQRCRRRHLALPRLALPLQLGSGTGTT